jgi:hypothetical protein
MAMPEEKPQPDGSQPKAVNTGGVRVVGMHVETVCYRKPKDETEHDEKAPSQ